MIIDCHNHVLAVGTGRGAERFMKDLCASYFQSHGQLPDDRPLVDEDWKELEWLFTPIDPDKLIEDHDMCGVDKCTVLAVAPSDYTQYEQRGTVDAAGVTQVGEQSIGRANDYIADLVRQRPDKLIGMAAVNPKFRGVEAAVAELERAVDELQLTGLKLYPMYDHYAVNDRDLAFPIFAKAAELDIPVMIHLATTTAADTVLLYGWPVLLDDVARAFPQLRILVCHSGFPWLDECLTLGARHQNIWMDVSFFNSLVTRKEMYEFLLRARRVGCPWSRICWGTDYPCFEMPNTLLPKFTLVNDEANGSPTIPLTDTARMIGGNYARFVGLDWSLDETVGQIEALTETWRQTWEKEGRDW